MTPVESETEGPVSVCRDTPCGVSRWPEHIRSNTHARPCERFSSGPHVGDAEPATRPGTPPAARPSQAQGFAPEPEHAQKDPAMTRTRATLTTPARRAFSLIELLVVITIIAIVIAITVPAIGAARDLARGTSTQSQLSSLSSAVATFQADTNRVPGYFSAGDMSINDDGFTSMQNIILDLAGGTVGEQDGSPQGLPEVGPNGNALVFVNEALIGIDGVSSKSYLQAGAVDFQQVEGKANVGNDQNLIVPEIVDAWGMPIMAWAENEFAPSMGDIDRSNVAIENFATVNEQAGIARFYWEQNAPLLDATALTDRDIDQSTSVLTTTPDERKPDVLAALLGSPADPFTTLNAGVTTANVSSFLPRSSKGGVLFQSAGRDRVYLSTEDRGFRQLGGAFEYARYFSPTGQGRLGENPWPDADGESGTQDIVGLFNDIVTATPR